ncbi:MAG TPA: c-type cytochrome domain-containing protein [Agriterribacter sp.]|nr:c-type cytochrome domain-containing protein [Agriterribacter sp.]
MILLSLSGFFGRFHPVLVHLPIGILILGVMLHWMSRRQRFDDLKHAVSITLLLGAISAIFSCISGWLLANGAEYDETILGRHRWLGISVAVVAIVYYLVYTRKFSFKLPTTLPYILSIALFVLITFTGHFGGTLTHGEGYLTQDILEPVETEEVKKIIPDVQQAMAYNDIIQPVLQNKCYKCHGPSKQKGKLRLDTQEAIAKGGEDGKVLVVGKGEESELYKRLILDMLEKKHMPPKGKSQPSEAEIRLIRWWIDAGASFNKPVSALAQDEKIKPLLLALQSDHLVAPAKPEVPEEPVAKAPREALIALQKMGVTVVPVADGSNYLSVNFLGLPGIGDKEIKLLEPLAAQLVWLKMGNTAITDSALTVLAKFPVLIKLSLDYTAISDKGIASLQTLSTLQYLNIVGTKVTAKGLLALKGLRELDAVYLYKTPISGADWLSLKKAFPKATLDTGGYALPLLEGDTTLLTKKP